MKIIVIGAGLAGAKAVEELREQGYDGDLTVIGAEPHLPYERPPLSKDLLLGKAEADSVFVHDQQWYDEHDVELRLGEPVTGLDLERRVVTVGGDDLAYDQLLLATGSSPRRLPMAEGADVVYLRTLDDSQRLLSRLKAQANVVIIGGGWIGLEIAAAAREADAAVTVVEMGPMPLAGVLGTEVAEIFADLHREHGVDLRLETGVDAIEGSRVTLTDGTTIDADLIVVGIGAAPDEELPRSAGLAVDNGVLVDARLRSSDPQVFAAGDVANEDHPILGRLRVEHWDNAIQQGKHAARSMLGDETPYDRQPYFFTDQYDLGMEYVGHAGRGGYDEVIIRGDRSARNITAFWVKDGTVVAGMHLNDWDATDPIRAIVGKPLDERLRDEDVPLADLG